MSLAARLGPALAARVDAAAAATPDPARPLAALERVLEREPDAPGLVLALADGGALPRALALLGLGGAPVEAFLAEPRDLLALVPPLDPDAVAREARACEDLDRLRALRRRTTLATAARELAGELEATRAAAHLSLVADALIDAALGLARARAAARSPAAAGVRLAVLALGKLGGRELNYSSDVDLVLARGDDDEADAADAVARSLVDALQGASAQGRLYRCDLRLRPYGASGALVPRASAVVGYYEEQGRTWERQALLKARPCAGDLALGGELLARLAPWLWRESLDARAIQEVLALRDRMAARVEAGARDVKVGPGGLRDVEFCAQFLQLLHGGRDPSLRATGTLDAVARLEAARVLREDEAADLRASYAFVRRLEHLLQLTTDRELTRLPEGEGVAPLARALGLDVAGFEARLADAQRRARRALDRHLRAPFAEPEVDAPRAPGDVRAPGPAQAAPSAPRVEPRGGEALSLAAATGGPGAAPAGRGPSDAGALSRAARLAAQDLLLAARPDPEVARAVLARHGFKDPAAAWRDLEALARERSFLAAASRARTLLAGLAPRLLAAIGRRPDPDRTLRNLERATATLGAKGTVWELMAESPDALELLVSLAAGSEVLCETLALHPGVLDEVIDRLRTRTPPTGAEVEAEVAGALGVPATGAVPGAAAPGATWWPDGPGSALRPDAPASPPPPRPRDGEAGGADALEVERALREARAVHLLIVAALDLGGRANVQNTGRALADAAEGFLRALLARARADVARRHGGEPGALGLALLAVGRLGGRELAWASDLDLVPVFAGSPGAAAPDGTDAASFAAEVVQAVTVLAAGRPSSEGPLLPIDLRLRPHGSAGPLAAALDEALEYWRRDDGARHFERLALQKARPVAGDPDAQARVMSGLSAALYERAYGPDLWDEVVTMRARQVEATTQGDLKRGPGSLADVELLASGLALRHGGRAPDLRTPHTTPLLGALERAGLLDAAEHRDLRTAYGLLRRIELRLRARTWRSRTTLPAGEPLRDLALALGYTDVSPSAPAEATLAQEVAFHRQRVQDVLRRVVARERARR